METWGERVERAAKVLGVPKEILVPFLEEIGVSEGAIKDATVEDFKEAFKVGMAKDQRIGSVAGPIKITNAYKILTGAVAAISDDASARDLLAAIDLKRPSEKSKKAATLLKAKRIRSDEPRTWGDAHFVVLADDGAIDLPTSDLAMSALESGAPDYGNGVFTSKEGRASAVFRLDDLTLDSPRSLRLHDPLEPGAFLDMYKVARKFSVVIDLDPERHQLLLFAVHRGHKSAPRDAAEAAALLSQIKAAPSTDAAAVALGPVVDALWRAARRAPPGSAAALPSITEAAGQAQSGRPGTAGDDLSAGDELSALVAPVPEGRRDVRLLQCVTRESATALLGMAKVTDIKDLLSLLGRSGSGGKDALIAEALAADPKLEDVFDCIVINTDGALNTEIFQGAIVDGFDDFSELHEEVLWRIFWNSVVTE